MGVQAMAWACQDQRHFPHTRGDDLARLHNLCPTKNGERDRAVVSPRRLEGAHVHVQIHGRRLHASEARRRRSWTGSRPAGRCAAGPCLTQDSARRRPDSQSPGRRTPAARVPPGTASPPRPPPLPTAARPAPARAPIRVCFSSPCSVSRESGGQPATRARTLNMPTTASPIMTQAASRRLPYTPDRARHRWWSSAPNTRTRSTYSRASIAPLGGLLQTSVAVLRERFLRATRLLPHIWVDHASRTSCDEQPRERKHIT